MVTTETSIQLLEGLQIETSAAGHNIELLEQAEARHLKDLAVNLQNVLNGNDHISAREALLLGVAIAANERHTALQQGITVRAKAEGVSDAEIAEAIACASILAANNVLYRFRHFTGKESYTNIQARIRMNTMMKPVLGKEFFELMSTAISAVNGCEMCVNAHEHSLIELGTSEERIFESIRIASVIVSATKIV